MEAAKGPPGLLGALGQVRGVALRQESQWLEAFAQAAGALGFRVQCCFMQWGVGGGLAT